MCVIHEQGNVGLEQRCDGAATAFASSVERFQVTGSRDLTATRGEIESKLQTDPSIDAVLTLDPDLAIAAMRRSLIIEASAALAILALVAWFGTLEPFVTADPV